MVKLSHEDVAWFNGWCFFNDTEFRRFKRLGVEDWRNCLWTETNCSYEKKQKDFSAWNSYRAGVNAIEIVNWRLPFRPSTVQCMCMHTGLFSTTIL